PGVYPRTSAPCHPPPPAPEQAELLPAPGVKYNTVSLPPPLAGSASSTRVKRSSIFGVFGSSYEPSYHRSRPVAPFLPIPCGDARNLSIDLTTASPHFAAPPENFENGLIVRSFPVSLMALRITSPTRLRLIFLSSRSWTCPS